MGTMTARSHKAEGHQLESKSTEAIAATDKRIKPLLITSLIDRQKYTLFYHFTNFDTYFDGIIIILLTGRFRGLESGGFQ
jgi:hypothetical protein